jgi:hypothetical protein
MSTVTPHDHRSENDNDARGLLVADTDLGIGGMAGHNGKGAEEKNDD